MPTDAEIRKEVTTRFKLRRDVLLYLRNHGGKMNQDEFEEMIFNNVVAAQDNFIEERDKSYWKEYAKCIRKDLENCRYIKLSRDENKSVEYCFGGVEILNNELKLDGGDFVIKREEIEVESLRELKESKDISVDSFGEIVSKWTKKVYGTSKDVSALVVEYVEDMRFEKFISFYPKNDYTLDYMVKLENNALFLICYYDLRQGALNNGGYSNCAPTRMKHAGNLF